MSSKYPRFDPEMDPIWRKKLTNIQYNVTREGGTERPFTGNLYLENRNGEYHCICCENLLFSSSMKFDSNCGWPSFHSEHPDAKIIRLEDKSHGMTRIELRCGQCDAHLGHIFDDGPRNLGGMRYCINSASMKFTAMGD